MLKSLRLQNIVLIDTCEIPFAPGLNILSGETGAGKSAIMQGLDALLGARADQKIIRQGERQAVIEAELADGSLIRREIGEKNRCLIDGKQVTLAQLQERAFAKLIGQGAYHALKSPAHQLELLDSYGAYNRLPFMQSYARVLEMGTPVQVDALQAQLDEIRALGLSEGEEDALFSEHHNLVNFQEVSEKAAQLTATLSEITSQLSGLLRHGDIVAEGATSMQAALTELQEAHYQYSSYLDGLEYSPARLAEIDERLSAINALKRKLGCNFNELQALETDLQTQIADSQAFDEKLQAAIAERDRLADALSAERQAAAKNLSDAMTLELQLLNMPDCQFSVEITAAPLSAQGKDAVNFILAANPGEAPVPIAKRASGGELSRILLALQLILNPDTPSLIFDEIDSNIGGRTATCIGEKLKLLGRHQQVICITHFPQVASCADHHLRIDKAQDGERTHTSVTVLDDKNRCEEIKRMLGSKV